MAHDLPLAADSRPHTRATFHFLRLSVLLEHMDRAQHDSAGREPEHN